MGVFFHILIELTALSFRSVKKSLVQAKRGSTTVILYNTLDGASLALPIQNHAPSLI